MRALLLAGAAVAAYLLLSLFDDPARADGGGLDLLPHPPDRPATTLPAPAGAMAKAARNDRVPPVVRDLIGAGGTPRAPATDIPGGGESGRHSTPVGGRRQPGTPGGAGGSDRRPGDGHGRKDTPVGAAGDGSRKGARQGAGDGPEGTRPATPTPALADPTGALTGTLRVTATPSTAVTSADTTGAPTGTLQDATAAVLADALRVTGVTRTLTAVTTAVLADTTRALTDTLRATTAAALEPVFRLVEATTTPEPAEAPAVSGQTTPGDDEITPAQPPPAATTPAPEAAAPAPPVTAPARARGVAAAGSPAWAASGVSTPPRRHAAARAVAMGWSPVPGSGFGGCVPTGCAHTTDVITGGGQPLVLPTVLAVRPEARGHLVAPPSGAPFAGRMPGVSPLPG